MTGLLWTFRNSRLLTLMLGHFTVDSYTGLIPVMFPLLIQRFHLDLATVGIATLAYTGVAAISQPPFGLLADRFGTRLTGITLAWTAACFALSGLAPTFSMLVLLAALAGLGSGAFHPLGALTVRRLLPGRGANTAMSIYVTAGTVGVACGPLLGVIIFTALGTPGTLLTIIPGAAAAGYLLLAMRREPGGSTATRQSGARAAAPLVPIVATVAVMMSRNLTMVSLQAYTPTWYHQLGYQAWFYGPLAMTLVLASAVGTVGFGTLGDRYGRRSLIIGCLFLSIPAVALYVMAPGPFGFLWAILVGFSAASTAPLLLMMAQELMVRRAGLAAGLILGLAFVTGAIGVPITGAIADRVGLQTALGLQLVVIAVTIVIALLLPSEAYLKRLREDRARAASTAALAAGK